MGEIAGLVGQTLQFLWTWSFGRVVTIFQVPFNTLPLWKQLLFVAVILAHANVSFKVVKTLGTATQSFIGATVGLISALLSLLPQIVLAGLIAFGGTWAILNFDPTRIDPTRSSMSRAAPSATRSVRDGDNAPRQPVESDGKEIPANLPSEIKRSALPSPPR